MVTTIQVNERTLEILKKLKQELRAKSYEEAIGRIFIERNRGESMAGSLKKYAGKQTLKQILKELQNERHKSDRF